MSDKPSGTFKGNLESYRFCDNVSLKMMVQSETSDAQHLRSIATTTAAVV